MEIKKCLINDLYPGIEISWLEKVINTASFCKSQWNQVNCKQTASFFITRHYFYVQESVPGSKSSLPKSILNL